MNLTKRKVSYTPIFKFNYEAAMNLSSFTLVYSYDLGLWNISVSLKEIHGCHIKMVHLLREVPV